MSPKTGIPLTITLLLLAALACSLPPSTPGSEEVIATSVAATLQAAESELSPTPTEIPPTETPGPTETPAESASLPLQFVYVQEGDVWLWQEGNPPRRLTESGDADIVSLAPDGELVAYTRMVDDIHQELWGVNADGSEERRLVSAAEFDDWTTHPDALTTLPAYPDWVPGTHTLAFLTNPTFEGPGFILSNDLQLVDAETGDLRTLLPQGEGGRFYYAPDGSRLAVVTPTQISLLNADGTQRSDVLTYPLILTYSEYQYYPEVVWLPDSSAARVVVPPPDVLAEPEQPTRIWHLPADGSEPTLLMEMVTVPFFANPPQLSPDGQRIAYLRPIEDTENLSELHLANTDGTEDTIYAAGQLIFSDWSPQGDYFIYTQERSTPYIGKLGEAALPVPGINRIRRVRWLDETHYLYLDRTPEQWELRLGSRDAPHLSITTSPDLISFDTLR